MIKKMLAGLAMMLMLMPAFAMGQNLIVCVDRVCYCNINVPEECENLRGACTGQYLCKGSQCLCTTDKPVHGPIPLPPSGNPPVNHPSPLVLPEGRRAP
jgi:hypothetical protein